MIKKPDSDQHLNHLHPEENLTFEESYEKFKTERVFFMANYQESNEQFKKMKDDMFRVEEEYQKLQDKIIREKEELIAKLRKQNDEIKLQVQNIKKVVEENFKDEEK